MKRIANVSGTWDIKPVPNHPELLLQGHYSGFSLLHKKGGSWSYFFKVKGFHNSARYFEFVDRQVLLVNHEYKGVYKINLFGDLNVDRFTLLPVEQGYKSSLMRYQDRVLYAMNQGIFYWDFKHSIFKKDTLLTPYFTKISL